MSVEIEEIRIPFQCPGCGQVANKTMGPLYAAALASCITAALMDMERLDGRAMGVVNRG